MTAVSAALAKNCYITALNLADNCIGDEGVSAVAGALSANRETMAQLDLSNNFIGPAGAAALARVFAGPSALRVLRMGRNKLGTRGGAAIACAVGVVAELGVCNVRVHLRVCRSWSVRVPDLSSCGLGAAAGVALGKALQVCACWSV